MASTNKTSLGLNKWELSDKPVREDFNKDNAIIDEKITKLNSDLMSGIITSGGTGRRFQMFITSFTIPKIDTATNTFDINDFIPMNAYYINVIQRNQTDSPVVIGTFKAKNDHWKIRTDVATTGFFSVSALYFIPK